MGIQQIILKTCIQVSLIMGFGVLTTAVAEQAEPERLMELRGSFEKAKERVMTPINARYLGQLEELRTILLQSNRLKDAVVVDVEIKRLKGENAEGGSSNRLIPEFDRLKEASERDREAALTPLNERYVEELAKLKVGYAKAGDLEGTLAVDREMKLYVAASSMKQEPSGDVFELVQDRSFELRGRRYLLIKGSLSYAEADELCRRLGGHLVHIETKGEDVALAEHLSEAVNVMRKNIWIGANDIAKEGEWVWGEGSRLRHEGWKAGEPNNNGEEDAAVIGRGGWWDSGAHIKNWALCEWEEWPPKFSDEINLEALKLML